MTSNKKATLRDIADAASVSPATVSLVINGKGEISPATRERVMEAASGLGYAPRPARSRAEVSDTLRFLKIAKHGHTVNRDHSHFISDYIDGMSAEARRRGYALEVVSHEGQRIEDIVALIAAAPVRGVVALGTELAEPDIRAIQASGVPTVFIDTFFDVVDASFVDMNNEDAVHQVLSRFQALGFRRIGFVASHVGTTNFRLRREAFVKTMQRLDLKLHAGDVLSIESTLEGAYTDALAWLRTRPELAECYFCTNDVIAYGFIKALRRCEIRIPEDVSIIGFDNLPLSSTMEPPLTTVDVSKRKIGYLAVTVLDDLINASEPQPAVKILVGAKLILRASDRGPDKLVSSPLGANARVRSRARPEYVDKA